MLKFIILIALIQGQISPFLCAFIFSLLLFTLGWLAGMPFVDLALLSSFKFILAFIYFWLLEKAVDGWVWWLIAIVGFMALIAG